MNFRINLLIACFMLSAIQLVAQSKPQEIRLFDLETSMPIVQATFEYNAQKGVSNDDGVIAFSYAAGATMILSHVTYGTWSMSDSELRTAIRDGVFYKRPMAVNLYPVKIIALKSLGVQPEGGLKIAGQDRLEHDAAALLNRIPAFNSIRKGGNYGFDPVFRGFKYDQLNIVMNGAQSATAACPNRMDPPTSQMAPNMMDRVEVLKGPHALRFGTGFGATINFIPAKLRFSSQPNVYGRLSSGYEHNGNLGRGESQLGFSGQQYDLSVFASWSAGNDYTAGNGQTMQSDFSRGSFGANMGFKLASNQQIRVSTTYNRARDADFPALPMDLRQDDTWLFNARHDIQLQGRNLQSWNTTIFGSFVDHLMDNRLKPLNPRMLNAETLATTYNYGGRTESVWQLAGNQLFIGADLRVEGADGVRERNFLMGPMAGRMLQDNAWQEGHISKAGLFAEYQIQGEVFNYILSGRMELNSAGIDAAASEFTQVSPQTNASQVNPSISMGILKEFSDRLQAGFWLARAQRSGSLTERFINYFPVGQDPYEMLGNPALSPEVNHQADFNIKWGINEKSAIDIDVYAAYLQDYISSVIDPTLTPRMPMSPGVRQFVNISEAFKTGFEVTWTHALTAGLSHQMGIAYTYGQDLERDEPLPEIAPLDLRYSLYGMYFNNKLKPELSIRYVARQHRTSNEFGETNTPSFTLLDLKMGYQLREGLSLNIGVANLLNENYYEHLNRSVRGTDTTIFAPGRNIFANVNFTF